MAAFKVGDRVRINCPTSPRHRCEGTVFSDLRRFPIMRSHSIDYEWAHQVCVDGWGSYDPTDGIGFAYAPHELEPLTPPPLAADILTMERLPEWSCPMPGVVR